MGGRVQILVFVGGKGPNSRVDHHRGRRGIGGRVQILVLTIGGRRGIGGRVQILVLISTINSGEGRRRGIKCRGREVQNFRVDHHRGRREMGGRVQILVLISTINPWGGDEDELSVVGRRVEILVLTTIEDGEKWEGGSKFSY